MYFICDFISRYNMTSASSLLSEEQCLCSICLDVFTDPVTIPCGHNFCKSCITKSWEVHGKYQCVMCKELWISRPELRVNCVLSEIADRVGRSAPNRATEQKQDGGEDVTCDICPDAKVKALKSCLVCLTSYCQTHLEPHQRIPGLKRHELIDPMKNLEERICKKHDKALEFFCKTDQMYMCQLCTGMDHKRHNFVPLKREYEERKATVERDAGKMRQMTRERWRKIEQIKQSVNLSREDANRETAASFQVFTALIQSVQKSLVQLVDTIEKKHKTAEEQAEGFIKELEEEISDLMERNAEIEQLLRTKDPLQFLQNLSSWSPTPPDKDWMQVRVHSSYGGTVRRAVIQLEETLTEKMAELCADVELKRVQQYAADVTLDPNTAHAALILSENKKSVRCGDVKRNLPDNPERFSSSPCVLGEQSFSSGRFYYEVVVKGKTKWDLGVASESINRKGHIAASPSIGLWVVWLKNGNEYRALDEPGVSLSLKSKPDKVGVFVDYEEGLISFYDVNAKTGMYSFTGCKFTEKLLPVFGPGMNDGGKNSAPLILSQVYHDD